jgi:cbb3-type cytochrome oxidase maturation protein
MDAFLLLTIAAVALGGLGVAVFFWTLRSGQYEDLDGAAQRILIDDEDDRPAKGAGSQTSPS